MDILETTYDCIVVGAGILGCSTAKYLMEKHPNWKVLLVDKYLAPGQGNTIKSNAAYRNIFDTGLNIHLAKASVDYYKSIQNSGIDLGLKEIGYLWLLSKLQYEQRMQPTIDHPEISGKKISLIDFLDYNSIGYKIYSKQELQELLPELKTDFTTGEMDDEGIKLPLVDIDHGLQGIECGSLSPDLLVKYYESEFRKLGGNTLYSTIVLEILLKEKDKEFDVDYIHTVWRDSEIGGIRIKDQDTEKISIIRTKKLLVATGAWINQLLDPLGINSTIKPKKRQLFRIFNMDSFVAKQNFNSLNTFPFLILPVGGIFIKPIENANAVDVGCSDDISRRFESTRVGSTDILNSPLDNPKGEQEFFSINLFPVLQKYFPDVFNDNLDMETPSAGMYAYSSDKFPVIDHISSLGNLYFVSGASGSGIMKADSIARICSALVSNEKTANLFNKKEIRIADFSVSKRNLPKETLVL